MITNRSIVEEQIASFLAMTENNDEEDNEKTMKMKWKIKMLGELLKHRSFSTGEGEGG